MPKGELIGGKRKVAGVVIGEVYLALLQFMVEEQLPNMSRAVGAALGHWAAGRGRVQNPSGGGERSR